MTIQCPACNRHFHGDSAILLLQNHWKKHHNAEGKCPVVNILGSPPAPPAPLAPAAPPAALAPLAPVPETSLGDDEYDLSSKSVWEDATLDDKIWLTLANLNGGKGLSRSDLESVLDLLGLVEEQPESRTIHTVAEWDAFQEQRVQDSPFIVCPKYSKEIVVDKQDVPLLGDKVISTTLYYEDMNHFLEMEIGNPKYRGHFVKHAQTVIDDENNRYVYLLIFLYILFCLYPSVYVPEFA